MADDPSADAQRALDAVRDRRRRQQMGPPLAQDDAALDALSKAGSERMAEIEAFVRDAAGQFGVDLLRAEPARG